MLMNGEVTRTGGLFSSDRHRSAAIAQTSAANEYGEVASWATTSRPVRRTDSTIASAVERLQRPRVDHLDRDPVLALELLGGLQRPVDLAADRDDGHVGALRA